MKIKKTEILELITLLGFKPHESEKNIYYKNYPKHSDYIIKVDFEKNKIEYQNPITLGDKTTSHFEASENFVVLECVNRLLEKGYNPKYITLEKIWTVGHKEKGKVDVFVTHPDGKPFLMIECKTWGNEFNAEFEKTLTNGGQLFSYYQQDRNTEFLCLYTSELLNNEVRYATRIIEVNDKWKEGGNKSEVFKIWKEDFGQTFKYNGIFDDDATPYNIILKNLKRKNLVDLQQGDSGYIFNQFAEILRHNVVSDKPNAFNKMFNLILAKIVDEEKADDEILDFQWLDDDDDIKLQKRLNDLYKYGMLEYLKKDVTDLGDEELDDILKNNRGSILDRIIRQKITELRLYKNSEFSFKEVFNEKSFNDNAIVIREAVKLLQPYQLRYSHKQQFLSNFFELLLSNTLKQESGQFFTPVPVAKFIIKCLPLKELTEKKIAEKRNDFLPVCIDFAAGSGHFLTETMEEIQQIIENLEPINSTQTIRTNINQYKEYPYQWAGKYIYGIEKDYRLAKIAKVSCFLNGDGLANIIHGDGLDSFNSDEYKEAPHLRSDKIVKDNPNFDVLVANPPYSVQSFIKTLPKGRECFDIFSSYTEQSKEIECLFIERMKQMIKAGGFVGIILPNSILNNSGVYSLAREIILNYFKVISIVEFGSATFMATGTNTIALFLQRRKDSDFQEIKQRIDDFFASFNKELDMVQDYIVKNDSYTITSQNSATRTDFEKYQTTEFKFMSEYLAASWGDIKLSDYLTFIEKRPNELILKTELFKEYNDWYYSLPETKALKSKIAKLKIVSDTNNNELEQLFYEKVVAIEKEKILYFMLANQQDVIMVKTNPFNDNEKEKQFLGYEFSSKRGHEGLRMFTDSLETPTTKLFSEYNKKDNQKVSSYIYRGLCGEKISDIHPDLKEHISITPLNNLLTYDQREFNRSISLVEKKKFEQQIGSKWPIVKLGDSDISEIFSGGTPSKTVREYWENGDINWATLVDTKNKYLHSTQRKITSIGMKNSSATLLPVNTVIFSSRATIGDVTIAKVETCTNQGYKNFVCNPEKLNYEYLYYILKREAKNIEKLASGMTYSEISKSQIAQYKIPLPPLHVQQQIVSEIQELENDPAKFLKGNTSIKEADILMKQLINKILDKYLL